MYAIRKTTLVSRLILMRHSPANTSTFFV